MPHHKPQNQRLKRANSRLIDNVLTLNKTQEIFGPTSAETRFTDIEFSKAHADYTKTKLSVLRAIKERAQQHKKRQRTIRILETRINAAEIALQSIERQLAEKLEKAALQREKESKKSQEKIEETLFKKKYKTLKKEYEKAESTIWKARKYFQPRSPELFQAEENYLQKKLDYLKAREKRLEDIIKKHKRGFWVNKIISEIQHTKAILKKTRILLEVTKEMGARK